MLGIPLLEVSTVIGWKIHDMYIVHLWTPGHRTHMRFFCKVLLLEKLTHVKTLKAHNLIA